VIGDGDIEAILALDDFAIDVEFPDTDIETRGIFTDVTQQVNILTNEVETVNPTIACETDSVSTVVRSHSAVVNGSTYTVERKERIGTGMSLVYLKT